METCLRELRALARPELVESDLKEALGFRSILVHGYTAVDPAILKDVLQNRLTDLDDFVRSVRARPKG